MFEINDKESFPQREEKVLAFWKSKEIFKKSLEQNRQGPLFSFYDGPPFATGLPHYGHLLAGTIKDVIPRYQTMKGCYVPRRFGWDCHGLPVENEIEKTQELSGASAIENFGIAKFNEECRSIVLRYTKEWEQTVDRMGRFVDFKDIYRTMDKSFMESVWWVFGELFKKGLIYEGFKVMPFSAKLGTPLSNFEANLNYKDVDDPSLTVTFPLIDDPEVSLLAWTTTPWTLPSNLAVCVHPQLDYVQIKDHKSGQQFILAEARLKAHFDAYDIVATFKGKDLQGKRYKPLFSYYQDHKNAFHILNDDFVSLDDGTGIVHMAPAFGESDFFVCRREGIEIVCPIDQNGVFSSAIPEYAGQFVKDADKDIIRHLKQQKRVHNHTQIRHRYPFCWRSDTPLIYKAVTTWFVAVERIKDRLLAANQQIRWVPSHIQEGRFGKWLENARDWAISRNRYWGTPIPLWRSDKGEIRVISSVAELERLTGQKITDLHRHFIDDLTFTENGTVFRRIPEVFDCWFESGSMPYAQGHFPFENEELTMKGFPADFIGEGLDQTRGWFYTLTVLSTALFDKPAFKNVIVNGIILAEDGNKMSKRLKNYPEPGAIIDKYGADAVRLYLLNSPAVKADDLRFTAKGVELVSRQVLIPFWNAYVFFSTYAKIYKWKPSSESKKPTADIDRWILSHLQKLIGEVTTGLDCYELNAAVEPFVGFIEQLTNWYIRRSRTRFWSEESTSDRAEAFETLYCVLMNLTKIAAPFIPFLSDAIYQELKMPEDPESVHLCRFPLVDPNLRNADLEKEMQDIQIVASSGHGLRKENKLKVRQPLPVAHVICADENRLKALKQQQHLIEDELNVKTVIYHSDETVFVELIAKPNFRVLGKKVGKLMNAVQQVILALPFHEMHQLLEGISTKISVEGEVIELTAEDVAVERRVKGELIATTSKGITVALETKLSEDLLLEGIARELVNKINTMRRDLDFAVTDRIKVLIETTSYVQKAFAAYRDYICHETLAVGCLFENCTGTEWDLNGERAVINLTKCS